MTLVSPFEADNPAALVCKASAVLQIEDETCEAHGPIVKMSDHKTELTIEMKSEGARIQFKRLWDESKKSHRISTSTGRSARIVSGNKHVGTIRSKTQNPIDDAEAKANSALTTYHQLAHSVFRTRHISVLCVHITIEMVRVLRDEDVGSVALWNCECCETYITRWVDEAAGDVSAMLTQIQRHKEQFVSNKFQMLVTTLYEEQCGIVLINAILTSELVT